MPSGIQSGKVLKMPGLGVPKLSNKARKGDQLVQIIVETPTKLSSEEKKLYQNLQKIEESKKDKKGWF